MTKAQLLEALAASVARLAVPSRPADAIDAELGSPARQTAVQRVRSLPEFQELDEAISDGLIAADLGHVLLNVVDRVIGMALTLR